jgi:hypothetical protein
MKIMTFYTGGDRSGQKHWNVANASQITVFTCEWSANNYVGVANVPDLNGNGSAEIASLYVDYITGKHTVKIRDPKTDRDINTLTFKTSFWPPQGLIVLKDINGNKVPEIGVLSLDGGYPAVDIKDAKNNNALLKTIRFLTAAYNPKEISVYPDNNGNGYNDITVLGIHKSTNTPKAETRDSKTGALLYDTQF